MKSFYLLVIVDDVCSTSWSGDCELFMFVNDEVAEEPVETVDP